MAKLTYDQLKQVDRGPSKMLILKNDKDTVQVRFLFESMDDIGESVHQLVLAGREGGEYKIDVSCLGKGCPLCAANVPVADRLFIPVYNITAGTSQIWIRPKSFAKNFEGLIRRYNPLCSAKFEIERNGAANYAKTTYQLYPIGTDGTEAGSIEPLEYKGFTEWSADEMEHYIDTGENPREKESGSAPGGRIVATPAAARSVPDITERPAATGSTSSRRSTF